MFGLVCLVVSLLNWSLFDSHVNCLKIASTNSSFNSLTSSPISQSPNSTAFNSTKSSDFEKASKQKSKVIVILADGIRYDYVSNLDELKGFQRLASNGVKSEVSSDLPSHIHKLYDRKSCTNFFAYIRRCNQSSPQIAIQTGILYSPDFMLKITGWYRTSCLIPNTMRPS